MRPGPIAVLVALAVYASASTVAAAAVAGWWRRPGRPRSAAAIFAARLLPAAAGLAMVLLATPAFVRYEPAGEEAVGPLLAALAVGGALLVTSGLWRAARALTLTWRLDRSWRAGARPVLLGMGLRAEIVDVPYPLVAVIGVVRPRVLIAEAVAARCTEDELRRMAAHEHAHVRARDNLKRLLLECCPDVLRVTATGAAMVAAWDAAAEDAADDRATGSDPSARAALAAVLVKVARLATGAPAGTGFASTLVGIGNVERRVRRLLADGPRTAAACGPVALAATLGLTAAAWLAAHPAVARGVHDGLEALVQFGR
ncbi:MAG: M48 family metalloprotease [Vicinamibacterales bacterium]